MDSSKGQKLVLVMVVALLVGGILACDVSGGEGRPTVNVTAPTSGAQFEVGQEVNVLVTASDPKGVTKVDLAVDGVLYRTDASSRPEGDLSFTIVQTWVATDPGMHTLTVTAINVDGLASDPWAISVEVVEEGMATPSPALPTATLPPGGTPPPPPTTTPLPPTPTATAGPPETPEITYFRANGTEGSITVAPGTTVTLSWEWERVEEGYLDPGNIAMACPAMPCAHEVSPEATTTYTLRAVNTAGTDEATVTVQIEEVPLPDLVLDGLSVSSTDVEWGDPIRVAVDVANYGTAPSGPYKVLWRYGSGDFDVCEWNQPSLPAGDGGTLRCDVDHIYTSYTTVATVDPFDEVEESDEENNRMEVRVNVGEAEPLPDLTIDSLTVTPPSPASGDPIHVRIGILNDGTAASGPYKILWRYGSGDFDVCEWSKTALPAGDGGYVECDVDHFYTSYNTVATVDWRFEVDESNEDNNSMERMVTVE